MMIANTASDLENGSKCIKSWISDSRDSTTLSQNLFARLPDQPLAVDLPRELLLSNQGVVVSPGSQATFSYQLRGQDTLTVGDERCWIEDKAHYFYLERSLSAQFGAEPDLRYAILLGKFESWCSNDFSTWRQLDDFYSIRNVGAVYDFLLACPHLIDVLLDAPSQLIKHFGPDPKVVLEIVSDPEVEAAEELVAHIFTSLSVKDARSRLSKLDHEWFLHQLDQIKGQFNLNLVFV